MVFLREDFFRLAELILLVEFSTAQDQKDPAQFKQQYNQKLLPHNIEIS
jgi:hypothetical protein